MPARRLLPGALALALTATALVVAPTAEAVTTPTLKWQVRNVGVVRESSPLTYDVNGDGQLDIVFGSRDGNVRVLHAADGSPVPGWPQNAGDPIDSSPAIADTDGDRRPEVFIGTGTYERSSGSLVSFEHDGRRRFQFVAADNTIPRPSVHGAPVLADVAGDGGLDVSFGSLGVQSIWSLTQDGRVHGGFPFYADDTVFSSPAVLDVDGNGRRDIVVGGDASGGITPNPVDFDGGLMRAISGDGRQLWEYRINDIIRSSPAIGDIDGDGQPEIVFGSGDFWGGTDSVKVFALDRQGRLKPGWPQTTDGVTDPGPTLADLNGDGRLDVVIGTFSSTHGRGGGGSVFAWDGAGRRLPGFPVASGGGVVIGSIVTADLEGNGGQDLLVPTGAGIFAYRGSDGARLFSLGEGQVTFHNSPAVADVDGNGRLDVIAAGTAPDGVGVAYRWELGPEARLGDRGWHTFHKDHRRTGSWVENIPPARAIATERVAGADRYATAAALARHAYPSPTPVVVVATGAAFADALAAGPVAHRLGGPVLLTDPVSLPAPTIEALQALQPQRVIILGGFAAVSPAVQAEIAAATRVVPERINGDNRFQTAAAVSAATFTPGVDRAFVATGESFADALAGGAAGAMAGGPILLVQRNAVPAEVVAELRRLNPRAINLIGGEASVSEAVRAAIARDTGKAVTRLSGPDRYSTAVAVMRDVRPGPAGRAVVATGTSFADALGAAGLAGKGGYPLLLVPGSCVPHGVRGEIDRIGASSLLLAGGQAAVSPTVGALTPCD